MEMDSRLRIGFVGPGWIGRVQLQKLLKRQDVVIAAVHGRDYERTAALLQEFGLPATCNCHSYTELLERDIDAVWLASPNQYHGPQAITALQADKHLFCEKPTAIAYSDDLELQRLSISKPHLVTFVDFVLYFNPMERKLLEMIRSGFFGDLTQVQINYRHPINTSDGRAWKLTKEAMGDAISMGISHALSVITWIFAANGQHPVSVFAISDQARVRPFEPDPIWNILVRFSGGGTAFCFGNIDFNNGYDLFHSVTGTEGSFTFDSAQPLEQKVRFTSQCIEGGRIVWPSNADSSSPHAWDPKMTLPDSGDVLTHGLDDAIESFLASVKSRTPSPLSLQQTYSIAEIGWAAQLSAVTGQQVSLPIDPLQMSAIAK